MSGCDVSTLPRLCLFHNFDWIPEAFPAGEVVFTYETGSSRHAYCKTFLEVIDATHVFGSIRRWCGDRMGWVSGVWHVDQIGSHGVVRVEAFAERSCATLLNTFVKPGCCIPAAVAATKEARL